MLPCTVHLVPSIPRLLPCGGSSTKAAEGVSRRKWLWPFAMRRLLRRPDSHLSMSRGIGEMSKTIILDSRELRQAQLYPKPLLGLSSPSPMTLL